MNKKEINPHDKFFKEMFSLKEVNEEFLHIVLPEEMKDDLDLKYIESVNTSFIVRQNKKNRKEELLTDLLYKTKRKNREEDIYLYFLYEHKSYKDKFIFTQLLTYINEIWKQTLKNGADKLPPVIPIVYYHGPQKDNINTDISDTIENYKEISNLYGKYLPTFQYFLYNVNIEIKQKTDKSLVYMNLINRLFSMDYEIEFSGIIEEIYYLMENIKGADKRRFIYKSALSYLSIKIKDTDQDKFDQEVNRLIDLDPEGGNVMRSLRDAFIDQGRVEGRAEGRIEGRAEGRIEGRIEGKKEMTASILEQRFGKLSKSLADAIYQADADKIIKIQDNIFEIKSLEEIEEYLN